MPTKGSTSPPSPYTSRLRRSRSCADDVAKYFAIIIALVPPALRGVQYRPVSADRMLHRNLGIYGLGGLVAPFIGIKIIDLLISAWGCSRAPFTAACLRLTVRFVMFVGRAECFVHLMRADTCGRTTPR